VDRGAGLPSQEADMSKRHLYILTGLLTAVGLGFFLYKVLVLGFPLRPAEMTEIWRIEAKLEFRANGGPVKAGLFIPVNAPGTIIVTQNFVSPGYGLITSSGESNRRATFSRRAATGEQTLYYRAVVHRGRESDPPPAEARPALRPVPYDGAELIAARAMVDAAIGRSADLRTLTQLLNAELAEARPGSGAMMLMHNNATMHARMRVLTRLLRLADAPARMVHGLTLEPDRRNAGFTTWAEIYVDRSWLPFDPNVNRFVPPEGRMAWWRGEAALASLEGGEGLKSSVSVKRAFEFTLQTALARSRQVERALVEFSVFGLPLQTQAVYQILLSVPIGIFLLVVLRNVIGVRTFGTFMPVLIALAFRQTELGWGLILFGAVLTVGLMVRFYLEQLKLLLVPRLAAVVIVVVLIMVALSIVSNKLGFERGLSVALFPIVILSMTIERMTVVWDERGPKEAFKQAGGSLLVAMVCYAAMNVPIVQHLSFVYPETLLVLLAATLLLGRYSGYRLVDLPRFKVLAGKR
jgi:hypothetical protein